MLELAKLRHALVGSILVTTAASGAAAQADRAALVRKLDSIAGAGVAENRTVGLAAAVVRGTDTLLFKGYGKADVEWNVPLPADAVFEIGSITKQFTAVAILQLRDEGKLSLDDEIRREMVVAVTQGPQGPLFSANGTPPREPASWIDGWSFKVGGSTMTFRRTGSSSGPPTELIFEDGAAYYVLKRQ